MNKKSFRLLGGIALVSALLLSTGRASFAQTTLDSEETKFLSYINQLRAQYGVAPLQVSASLENSAHWMSADMAAKNYYSDTDSLGRGPAVRLEAFGYTGNWDDEIAQGYPDAASMYMMWLIYCNPGTSCVHGYSQLMLSTRYQVVGIGRAYNASSQYGWYWNLVFGSSGSTAISAPTLVSATAQSPTSVALAWTPGTSGQAAGFQITRNGSVVASLGGSALSYTDTTVSPNTTYYYSVTAFDSSGNRSGGSNTLQVTTPGSVSLPVISSFTAAPSTVAAGQAALLSWSVSGTTNISLDNGIGNVSNTTSKSVSPTGTTTYTLTATNGAGSTTAHVTVTVSAGPTVPTLLSAAAASPTQVNLNWSASTGSLGVAGYQITRSGSHAITVPATALSYADVVASPSSTYTYFIRAYDSAGNYSGASNTIQVTTPAASNSTSCAGPALNAFTACYYNNITLSGNPAFERQEPQIYFVWGAGSPDASVQAGNFSARWQGNYTFAAGNYTFQITMSDGVRLFIDGNIVLDKWCDQAPSSYTVSLSLNQGNHLIVVEYYEHTNVAEASLNWIKN